MFCLCFYFHQNSSQSTVSLSGDPEVADRIQMAEWSPVGHSMAIVVGNDLYYLEDATTFGQAKRLTTSGTADLIFNGIADWLYEGEMKFSFFI